jgi:hypothetical protein
MDCPELTIWPATVQYPFTKLSRSRRYIEKKPPPLPIAGAGSLTHWPAEKVSPTDPDAVYVTPRAV